MPQSLDSDEFPFTKAELERALAFVCPAAEAAATADELAEMIVSTRAEQEAAAAARARGSREPQDLNPAQWHLGPEIYALLWCLPECSSRVDRLIESEWSRVEASYAVSLLARGGNAPVLDPARAAPRMTAPARRGVDTAQTSNGGSVGTGSP